MNEAIALLCVTLGLSLDALNLAFGYRTARGLSNESGLALVPFALYAVAIALSSMPRVDENRWVLIFSAFALHLVCWQIVPAFLDRVLSKVK